MAMGVAKNLLPLGTWGQIWTNPVRFDAKDNARSPGTYYTQSILAGILALAVRHGTMSANPVREIEIIGNPGPKTPRSISNEEREQWFELLNQDERALQADLIDEVPLPDFVTVPDVRVRTGTQRKGAAKAGCPSWASSSGGLWLGRWFRGVGDGTDVHTGARQGRLVDQVGDAGRIGHGRLCGVLPWRIVGHFVAHRLPSLRHHAGIDEGPSGGSSWFGPGQPGSWGRWWVRSGGSCNTLANALMGFTHSSEIAAWPAPVSAGDNAPQAGSEGLDRPRVRHATRLAEFCNS
jgi:hypothetical protein